jgi:hypothetical protein
MGMKRLLLLLLVLMLANSAVSAETVTWSASGGGYWSTSANWSTNSVPGADDDVVINNSGSGAITVDSDAAVKSLILSQAKNIVVHTNSLTISTPPNDIIYVSKNGLDSNPGTIDAPKLTINGAIAAITGSIKKIYVSAGVYNENVTLSNGISLYGGFSATNWNDRNVTDRENATYRTFIQSSAASHFAVAFSGTSTVEWILEGFAIETNHAANSYGINAYLDGTATIRYNTIYGGSGSNESIGIYIHGSTSRMIVTNNIINGGGSTVSTSHGIYIETAADQSITDNTINGGTGDNASRGIVVTHPLTSASVIARNSIDGGSSAGGQSYGIILSNNNVTASSLNVSIYGNYIHVANTYWAYGIYGYGNMAGMSVQPGIFNNVIEAGATGSGGRAYGIYFESAAGTPLVYNNTIAVSSVHDQTYGIWTQALSAERATTADVQNNIFIGESPVPHDFALVELANGLYSNIKNNDIYNCSTVISSEGTPKGTVAELNALRPTTTSGNIDADPVLSASPDRNLTASSPPSVTQGGLDFSAVSLFPESSGNKIDKAGTVRTSPWSIGAYERN